MSESPKSPPQKEESEEITQKEKVEKNTDEIDVEDFKERRRKRKNKDRKKEEKEKKPQKKRYFAKEIKSMLYGFGDVSNPLEQTIDVVEDIAIEYIHEIAQQALTVCGKKGKLTTDDFVKVSKKDPKKNARVEELLRMNEELKKAKKAFETDESRLNDEQNEEKSNL